MKVSRILFLSGLFLCAVLHQSVLIAADQWDVETIVDGYRVGKYTSLEIMSSGDPAISCYDYSDGDLEYSWFESDQWWTETIDSEGDVGAYTSLLCLPNGQPAISYIDKTNSALKYAWFDGVQWHCIVVDEDAANGYTCLRQLPNGYLAISYAGEDSIKYAWYDGVQWNSTSIDSVPIKGGQTSMTMVHSKPFITYYDGASQDLKAAQLFGEMPNDPNQWSVYPLDSVGNVGFYNSVTTSLAGDPMVCYYDSTNKDLKYTCLESSPYGLKSWSSPIIIDAEGTTGQYCSIAVVSGAAHSYLVGTPIVSYFHKATDQLRFAWFDGMQWQIHAVDSAGWVGRYTSLKILDSGEPAVCYNLQSGTTSVRYATFYGFGWRTENVQIAQLAGLYVSLEILSSGDPAMSYQDVTNGYLKYTRFDGQVWQTDTISDAGIAGYWTSLANVGGQPAISYQEHHGGWKLKYAWYDGVEWKSEYVDTSPDSGSQSSLAVSHVDQLPRISYVGNDDLRYAWHDGATWHAGIVIDGDGDVGYYTSLAFLPSGKPAISYWDRTHTNVKYAELEGDDESNPDHWKTYTIDSVKNVGEWTSLVVWGNEPAISYYDSTNHHLKFAWRAHGAWQTTTIDTGVNTGQYTNLAMINGKPAVSYRSNGDLKYMDLIGSDPANPLDWKTSLVDTGDIKYGSLASYGGHPAIAYFDNAHGDLKLAFGSETN
jgi:hypothetical protein